MQIVRKILGSIILFFDWLFTPRGIQRDENSQKSVDQQATKLKLYQFHACPFCVKVRRAMKRHSLNIEQRDAKNDSLYRNELLENGGRIKVPCLRIEDEQGQYTWMYESSNINNYLQKNFS